MTGRRAIDPNRPTCKVCNRVTNIYCGQSPGRRYECPGCGARGTAEQFPLVKAAKDDDTGSLFLWTDMVIVAQLPPAVQVRKNATCERRVNGQLRMCEFRADCEENLRRGGAAMCESVVVELCGAEKVVW